MASTHPYDELTPDTVLDALATVGLHGDGRLLALSSYENRVYQVQLEDEVQGHAEVVVKFYRPQRWSDAAILEEHAFAAELVQGEVPVVAPLVLEGGTLHHHAGFAFSVSPPRAGGLPEPDALAVRASIGPFPARIHTVGARTPFRHRPQLDLRSFGTESRDWLVAHEAVPLDVQADWKRVCDAALDKAASLLGGAGGAYADRYRLLRVHGDCHPGNILWTPDAGPHFVDLDDARTAPAVQDLWMLLSGERAQRQRQLGALLDGYEQVRDFDRAELVLLEPLRTLRLVHYSAWLARRWDDPAFPAAFPWFGSSDYWKGQIQVLEDQLEAMDEPPLVA
jgi:Ser/Thr protein kinase RdoA (MazF antagonist)